MSIESVDISSLVAFLKMRKERNTVLVLGSRTGAFFRNQDLQTITTLYSMHGLGIDSLSSEDHFKEIYTLLTQGLFNPDEIDTILTASLKNVDVTENDLLLAEIIKQGWFDVLISTNVDNMLEQLLERRGMRELRDFDVCYPVPGIQKGMLRAKKTFPCKIIKVFGELRTGKYSIKRDGYLAGKQALKNLLKSELKRDIIAFGLDPVWDAEILRILPAQGDTIWLVSNKKADATSILYKSKQKRQIKYLTYAGDDYGDCVRELHSGLLRGASSRVKEDVAIRKDSDLIQGIHPLVSRTDRIQVTNETLLKALDVVRSSPLKILSLGTVADIKVYEALHQILIELSWQKIIGPCDYRLVMPGMNTAEIDERLKDAAIVLPLISRDFIAIYGGSIELNHLMELSVARKLRVIPILVRDYNLAGTVFERLAPLPGDGVPVTLWPDFDSALVNISKGIRKVAEELSVS